MVVNAEGSECTALGDLSERDFSLWESKRHVMCDHITVEDLMVESGVMVQERARY